MGNQTSHHEIPEESLHERLDYIATHYILTMDFKSLRKMYDKEYCNKLVLITSKIFQTYFTDLEIDKIANDRLSESVLFLDKDDLKYTNETSQEKRLSICKQISIFYVKIAHVFAAIVMTINPEYVYTNSSGKMVKRSLYEKDKIPKNVKVKIDKMNICDERITALKKGQNEKENPFCYFNLNEDDTVRSLEGEPGIPELMQLYMDDKFDYKTGHFLDMSEEAKSKFLKDLQLFYKEFTGESEMPETITKFADIKLKNYGKNMKMCKKGGGGNSILEKDLLLKEYATNLKNMIANASAKQEELLHIINQIFISIEHGESKKKFIRINPNLNNMKLQNIVEDTRNLIIELYLQCEMDFTRGIHMYEAIIESRIFETTQRQIENLQKTTEMLIQRETEQQGITDQQGITEQQI